MIRGEGDERVTVGCFVTPLASLAHFFQSRAKSLARWLKNCVARGRNNSVPLHPVSWFGLVCPDLTTLANFFSFKHTLLFPACQAICKDPVRHLQVERPAQHHPLRAGEHMLIYLSNRCLSQHLNWHQCVGGGKQMAVAGEGEGGPVGGTGASYAADSPS